MKLLPFLCVCVVATAQTWTPQTSGTTASLRGVSAVDSKVIWASGSGGTWLRTVDGGATWSASVVAGAEALDFRGVRAIDVNVAYLMSSGSGDKSRIYKTTDAGAHWKLIFTNPDAKGFFDGIAFWDARNGIVAGDAVEGKMTIFTTQDGGEHWNRQQTPPAMAEEGAFAASNSSLIVKGKKEAWLGTGGRGSARVYHSKDAGRTWTVAATPIRNDVPSAGIFSLAFSDARHGFAVGGDYSKDKEARQNLAVTSDGGRSWTSASGPNGFRSAIIWIADSKSWLATGTSGSDISVDNGRTWRHFDAGAYNAISAVSGPAVWAVGPKGRIAFLTYPLE